MKDSDIICRLIYCAWIGPVLEQGDFDEFRAVLDCFARAVEREKETDRQTARPEPVTAETAGPQPSPVVLRAKNVRSTSA